MKIREDMKYFVLLMVMWVINIDCAERRVGQMNRTQLRLQQVQEVHAKKELRTQAMHSGMRTLLEYAPMFAVGTCLYVNSLNQIGQKCWVQEPNISQEECDLLKQCVCGAALCITASGYFGKGCNDLCEAGICSQENWCRDCCVVGAQECCWLLGMKRNG
jgi:hypothetical protein